MAVPGDDVLRVADPALHVGGRVGEMAGDDHAQCNAVERRADHPGRGAHALSRVAAAAAVLDEHRFATRRIASGGRRGMVAHAVALLGIFVGRFRQAPPTTSNRGERSRGRA